ncbi:MAG TPA: tetratricopeptide repeat protein, partial [Candidatus Omnitrophota bacterium]|nr:tetratricopeptide repeat protein [Candidatus Omnitrophota bacterium]
VARNHDYRDETAFLEQTKRCAPWSPIVHNNLGGIYLLQGRTQEGLRELEQALALDPGNGLAWFNLGAAYCSAGMYDRALSCYQRSVERVPRSRSYNQMGILYGMQRRFPEAEEAFRQALSQDPDFADAYYNLGKVYWDQQRWAEVEDIWTQGLAKDPRHPAMKEWLERLRNTGVRKAQ